MIGHVFPGATLPFGMAKAVADVNDPEEKQGGFASGDSDITGFSHMQYVKFPYFLDFRYQRTNQYNTIYKFR